MYFFQFEITEAAQQPVDPTRPGVLCVNGRRIRYGFPGSTKAISIRCTSFELEGGAVPLRQSGASVLCGNGVGRPILAMLFVTAQKLSDIV